MADMRTLKLNELQGMAVLNSDTGEKLGVVSDVLVHPVEGRVMGITIRDEAGAVTSLGAHDLFIGVHAVMTRNEAKVETWEPGDRLAKGALASREVVGTNVVTEDGRLIGQVSEVYISTEKPLAYYKVAESTVQRFFGTGFVIPGDAARAYSTDGVRMIVPVDIEERYSAASIEEILKRDQGGATSSPTPYGNDLRPL